MEIAKRAADNSGMLNINTNNAYYINTVQLNLKVTLLSLFNQIWQKQGVSICKFI